MPETMSKHHINRQESNQNRLNSKLKERLGYLGVYSQRDPEHFLEHLSSLQQRKVIKEFKLIYSQIITDYFTNNNQTNYQIDRFVEKAFLINLPLGEVVQIHLELIDNLTRELKFKGLSQDYLTDYRLTLIDVLAHLGEMYRSVITENCVVSSSI